MIDRTTDRQAGAWLSDLTSQAALLATPVGSIVRFLPLFTLVGTIGIPAHCPSVHLSERCNLEPDITLKKTYSNLLHETWYVIKWQYAYFERYFFAVARTLRLLWEQK